MGATVNLGLFNPQYMTTAINRMPNVYDLGLQSMFRFVGETSPVAMLEVRDQKLSLIPTKPYGGLATVVTGSGRSRVPIAIPHTPAEGLVNASDVSGISAFGSTSVMETVADRVLDVTNTIKRDIDQTMEFRRLSALKGVVMDSDGSTALQNLYTLFGISQATLDFDLSNTATDVKAKCSTLYDTISQNLLGDRMTGVRCIVSKEFFDKLKDHKSVKELYTGWVAAATLAGAATEEFTFCGITFVKSVAQVGGMRFVAINEGHAYPVGTVDTFIEVAAPAQTTQWVNTVGQRYYAQTMVLDYDAGMAIKAESNLLPLCLRPATLVKVFTS